VLHIFIHVFCLCRAWSTPWFAKMSQRAYNGCVSVYFRCTYCEFSSFQLTPHFIHGVEHRRVQKRICETTARFHWKKSRNETRYPIVDYVRPDVIFRNRWALIARDNRHKERSYPSVHFRAVTECLSHGTDGRFKWRNRPLDREWLGLSDLFPLGKFIVENDEMNFSWKNILRLMLNERFDTNKDVIL